ncbi:ImmA/IrrE family metallo-endopeptidase [Chlorobium limicola]
MKRTQSHSDTKNALDQLFSLTIQYRSSQAYREMLNFISKFRFYSPFNAFLIHTQKRGATYVAPPQRWLHDYGRSIKPGAQPIVILQPMGPVMFVFDVGETELIPDAKNVKPLPLEVEQPFEVRSGTLQKGQLKRLVENAKRDGIRVTLVKDGSCSAGSIEPAQSGNVLKFKTTGRKLEMVNVPVKYELFINSNGQSEEAQYGTIVHELAHLYCGHLGTPDAKLWPDRTYLDHATREFEVESVSYIVCNR